MGVVNVGKKGTVSVDGETFEIDSKEVLYIGKGAKEIIFDSANRKSPAHFYFLSYPAHTTNPTAKVSGKLQASPMHLGSIETSNERTVYKYIHGQGSSKLPACDGHD